MASLRKIKIIAAAALGVAVGISAAAGFRPWHFSDTAVAARADLSFPIAGQLAFVEPVGTPVAAGDVVARLENTSAAASAAAAQTALAVENAKAAELSAVGQEQESFIKKAAIEAGQQQQAVLAKDEQALVVTLADAASTTQSAVFQADTLFTDSTSTDPLLLIPTDSLSAAAAESGRVSISANIVDLFVLGEKAVAASSSPADLEAITESATADVAEVQLFLESLAFLERQASTSAAVSAGMLTQWQESVASARVGINDVINSVLTAGDNLEHDQNSSPTLPDAVLLDDQLAAREASQAQAIANAQALASSTAAALAKTILKAPLAGIISAPINGMLSRIGQNIGVGQPIVSIVAAAGKS